jgi:phage-related protein
MDLYCKISIDDEEFQDGINRVRKSLSGFASGNLGAESSIGKLHKALSRIDGDAESASDAMKDATDSTEDFGDAMDDASDRSIGFADVLKANLLGNVIVSGIKALGGAVKNMAGQFIDSAATVKAQSSQFEQTFGEFQNEATEAIRRVASEGGILETRLNTLGSRIYAFARSSGGDASESLGLMERALRVAADSAAYYDTSVEQATETLQSFLKGNFENDAALGLSATETTRNAAAMDLFGKEFKELSEIQKQETLLKMVEDSQKLSGAMGQASREADGWENVMGNLNEAWRQFQANVGTPILENLTPIVQDITTAFQGWMSSIDWDAFGTKVNEFVNAIIDNGPTIISIIAGIGAGFVAWNVVTIIQGVVSSINAFRAANEGATIAQLAMNAAMSANPIAIVITAITGLIAVIGTLWATSEDFRNAVSEIWGNIKDAFVNAWEAIKAAWDAAQPYFQAIWDTLVDIFTPVAEAIGGFFSAAWDAVKVVWDKATGFFQNIWNTIQGIFAVVESVLSGDFSGAWEAIKGVFAGWKDFFSGLWDDLTGVFSDAWNWFVGIGEDIVNGIWQGIKNIWGNLKNWFSEQWDNLVGGVKDFLGIHSPSRVFAGIGKNMALGLGEGWEDSFGRIRDGITRGLDFGTASVDFASSGLGMSSAGIINSMAAGADAGLADGLTVNLTLPDGTTFATWQLPYLIKAGSAAGTPIAEPQRA